MAKIPATSLLIAILFLAFFPDLQLQAVPEIAVILPETGRNAAIADMMRNAIEVAISNLQAENNLFAISFHDNLAVPDSAESLTRRLGSNPEIVSIIGGYPSSCAIRSAAVAETMQIPYLIISASADTLTRSGYKYTYRIAPPSTDYNDGLIGWALNVVGDERKVVIFQEDHQRSREAVTDLQNDLKSKWRSPIETAVFQTGTRDFAEHIDNLKRENPTLVFVFGATTDVARFLRQCREKDWNPVAFMLGTVWLVNNRIISLSEGAAEYIFGPALWWQNPLYPGAEKFINTFNRKVGEKPDYHAAEAYAAIQVLADAVQRYPNITRERMKKALDESNVTTVMGQVRFDNYRGFTQQNRTRTLAVQLQREAWKTVWPLELSDAEYVYPPPDWRDRERLKYEPEKLSLFAFVFIIATMILLVSVAIKRKELLRRMGRRY